MGKTKKKRKPVTVDDIKPKVKVKQKSCKIIGKLHEINKRKEQMKNIKLSASERQKLETSIKIGELEIGGLNNYQYLSKSAEKFHGNFNSAKWVIKQLKELNLPEKGKVLRLLDVGALDINYHKYRNIVDVTYIDLNPQVPGIVKADFLEYMNESKEAFDIIVLSLVINFAGDPSTRGRMLLKALQLLRMGGHLVIVLPLACVDNSRYLTSDHLTSMLASLGFKVIMLHRSRKLVFFLTQKIQSPTAQKYPKKLQTNGPKMNNFAIIL